MKKTEYILKKADLICKITLFVLILLFAGWLGYMSLKWSQILFEEELKQYLGMYLYKARDHQKNNILFSLVLFAITSMLALLGRKKLQRKHITYFALIESVILVIVCYVYTQQMQSTAWADQQQVLTLGAQLANGNLNLFSKGSYLALYPHQVGISYFISILIRLFPNQEVQSVFQLINCFCVGGITFIGYRIVDRLWKRITINIIYLCLQGLCFPLMFYSVYVYGEIIHIFAIMVFLLQIVKIIQNEEKMPWVNCLIAIFFLSFAILVRMNTLIVVIATAIVSVLQYVFEKRKTAIIVLLCTIAAYIIALIFPKVIMSGNYTDAYSYPKISWVYMGTLDGKGFGYGSYDGTVFKMFEEMDFNREIAKDQFSEALNEKIEFWKQNPDLMVAFQREKLLWQWSTPCYRCFDSNRFHKEGFPIGTAYEIAYGKYRQIVFDFMDSYQSFSYFSLIIGTLFLLKKREHFISWIWAIIFIGGVLFSIMWEASPRYVLPYMVLILPCCAYGVASLAEKINTFYIKIRHRNEQ